MPEKSLATSRMGSQSNPFLRRISCGVVFRPMTAIERAAMRTMLAIPHAAVVDGRAAWPPHAAHKRTGHHAAKEQQVVRAFQAKLAVLARAVEEEGVDGEPAGCGGQVVRRRTCAIVVQKQQHALQSPETGADRQAA